MSVLTLLNPFGWFGAYRAKLSGGSAPGQDRGAYSDPSSSGVPVTPDKALQLEAYWACVKIIAQTIGTLPLTLNTLKPDGSRAPAPDNPLYDLLGFMPNADNTATEFWEACGGCLAVWGDFFAVKHMAAGRIVSLEVLRPFWMDPYREKDGTPIYRYTDPVLGRTEYRAEDLLHVKGFGFGDMVGLSPIQFNRQTLGRAIAANEAAAGLFRNGLKTPGYFEYKGTANGGVLNEEQLGRAKKAIIEPMQGSVNAGTPGMLPASFGWVSLGINPVDAELMTNRRMSVEEICRSFGVPPVLVGHAMEGQTMWGSGVEHIVRAFMTTGLRPYLHRIETCIGRDIIGRADWKKLRAVFEVDELLRGDSKAQSDIDMQDANSGIRTRNEIRARRNLPPLPGGDALTANGALMPLTLLGQKPPAPGGGDGSSQGGEPKPEPGDLPKLPTGGMPDRKDAFDHSFSWQKDILKPPALRLRDALGRWTKVEAEEAAQEVAPIGQDAVAE